MFTAPDLEFVNILDKYQLFDLGQQFLKIATLVRGPPISLSALCVVFCHISVA